MNVLVVGSGGREHAICKSLKRSKLLDKLYIASSAVFEEAVDIRYSSYEELARKCKALQIDIVIVGPEAPICDGIADIFRKNKINIIAPTKKWSNLESSKLVAKQLMSHYSINNAPIIKAPTAFPLVLKADGLCGGKGVKIIYSMDELVNQMEKLKEDFPEGAKKIFMEEYLEGEELSMISLWDGKNLLHFPPARDFKRLSLDKNSPNTGGMGSYCPVNLTEVQQDRLDLYKTKLNFMLSDEKADFIGFIYSGLIWAKNDWYVLEYNMRPGDPETQSILNQLDTDFLYILNAAIYQKLDEIKLRLKGGVSATLVVASDGYPQQPKDGNLIEFPEDKEIVVHYSGVELKDEKLYSKGGRNLSITTSAGDLDTAFNRLYSYSDKILMDKKYVRRGLPEN